MSDETKKVGAPAVVIWGAGVAGLSAAHELVTRGFNVFVYEAEEDPRAERDDCQVGGMARSQWARVDETEGQHLPRYEGRFRPVKPIRQRIRFKGGSAALDGDAPAAADGVADVLARQSEIGILYVYGTTSPEEDPGLAEARASAVREHLVAKGIAGDRLRARGLRRAYDDDRGMSLEEQRAVFFEKSERLIPGEHGYRFFPSFYAHLFDTMKRTPLFEERRRTNVEFAKKEAFRGPSAQARERSEGRELVATGRTAFDNLIAMTAHEIDREDGIPPEPLGRGPARSLAELGRALRALFRDMQFSPRDMGLFESKMLQYATSCAGRRGDYEKMSWLELIEIDRYSPEFKSALEHWPQALVAMRASRCDARTFGNVALQLLLDLVRPAFTDAILNGPTSEAWLDPWRTYLERVHQVQFRRGRLERLKFDEQSGTFSSTLAPSSPSNHEDQPASTPKNSVPKGYVVLALPLSELVEVLDGALPDQLDRWNQANGRAGAPNPLRQALGFAARAAAPGPAGEKGTLHALADFSGIQYFFHGDIHFIDGHTYFPDSKWGLSAIPQAHFRKDPMSWRTTFRGVLSVDIGQLHAPGGNGKDAWNCTPDEIAAEVLAQVRAGLAGGDRHVPEPIGYHLDDSLVFEDDRRIKDNRSRFLINPPGDWERRPGEPGAYELMFGRLVLAGTYMKTFTRLTTMEAANESARHAVNAILKSLPDEHRKFIGNFCKIWPIEERELDDLDLLKEIDRGLWERGLPHAMEIGGVDALVDWLLPSAPWPRRER